MPFNQLSFSLFPLESSYSQGVIHGHKPKLPSPADHAILSKCKCLIILSDCYYDCFSVLMFSYYPCRMKRVIQPLVITLVLMSYSFFCFSILPSCCSSEVGMNSFSSSLLHICYLDHHIFYNNCQTSCLLIGS